jgi:hypothetical protein
VCAPLLASQPTTAPHDATKPVGDVLAEVAREKIREDYGGGDVGGGELSVHASRSEPLAALQVPVLAEATGAL